jgi:thiazole synthase
MLTSTDEWLLYGETFKSRLLLGTSRYPSPDILAKAAAIGTACHADSLVTT